MHIIRDAQIDAIVQPTRLRFIEALERDLATLLPGDPRFADASGLRADVESAIRAARAYGIEGARAVLLFAALVFDRGEGFEQQAGNAWIARLLHDPETDESDKMDAIYARLSAEAKRAKGKVS